MSRALALVADEVLAPPLPRELQVEVTGACNLRCRMCLVRYRPPLDRVHASLSLEQFARLIDEIPTLERVTLQGLGEPLLVPDLVPMVEHAAARGIAVGFNTNGTRLTPDKGRALIDAGLAWLCVSLDGATAETFESIRDGATFAKVGRNIARFVETRTRLGVDSPELSVVFVAMRRNLHELPDLVRLVGSWGVPRLRVQNLSHRFDDCDPSGSYAEIRRFAEEEALWGSGDQRRTAAVFAEAARVADESGVELRLPRLDDTERASRPPGAPRCGWPWDSAYVTHDGTVQPCCMVMGSDRAALGNVFADGGFAAVWRSAPYQQFRAGLLEGAEPPSVCAGCSIYHGVF